ncbi:MAG: 2-deoxy-D-gluconate 3-dehydrogenase [Dehalococcoidales bacterium]|jgi:2-deoxy-D-gluconate 3-dehydrogenase|nr:2-deoxy-D-gluconate 3-dehydrogenase [Dehalococcoidales bacterium]MDP6577058.1 glucose 1-dehydrogenase [Dehalococcoidales bacterium]
MEFFDLSGKVAIVTGGNQGIGLAIARGLAAAGATVVIANRRAAEGRQAAESLQKEGLGAAAVPTDVSNISSVAAMVSRVISDFGKIDILVNNAAVIVRGLAEDVLDEDWDRMMNTNLRGLFFCCQLVGKEMIKQQKGKIINVSSVISQLVQSGRSVYAISKAGVSHLTRALAMEWSKYNISVNAISPGLTITSINCEHFAEHPDELEEFVKVIPRGRVGSPSDYAGAAVFLASDASDYVCGQTLLIDGGMALP